MLLRVAPVAFALTFVIACAGGGLTPPPEWFSRPPAANGRHLFFAGDATGSPDAGMARDLAVQKALASLSQYCGAVVKSDFESVERETNGRMEQMVSLTVDVAGEELTLREAVVEQTFVRDSPGGGFDGFALVRWPRAQYQRVLALQQARAQRALQVYLLAESSLAEIRIAQTKARLREARAILGPARAQTPIDDARFADSGLLWDAIQALEERVASLEAARRGVIAVGVDCSERSAKVSCPARRVGRIRERVAEGGLKVSSTTLAPELARSIASSESPEVGADVRDSGYVLAVTYDAEMLGEEDGFTFARCGARGVIYDTDDGKIVSMKEVSPKKGGHLHFRGAVDQGCSEAEDDLVGWLGGVLRRFESEAGR